MIKIIVNAIYNALESHGINSDILDSDIIRVKIGEQTWCYIVFEDNQVYIGNYDSNRSIGCSQVYYGDPALLDIILDNLNKLMIKHE